MPIHNVQKLRELDAAIEALSCLQELKRRRRLHIDFSVPLVADREVAIALAAADAIIEKHGISLHDANMLFRAGLMTLLHGYVGDWAKRSRSEHGFA